MWKDTCWDTPGEPRDQPSIREQIRVEDIMVAVTSVGQVHIASYYDNRWTKRITE